MSAGSRVDLSFWAFVAFCLVIFGGAVGTVLGVLAYGSVRNDYDLQLQTRTQCIEKHDDRACRIYEVDYGK